MSVGGVLLAGVAATGLWGWRTERQKVFDLEARLQRLEKQEMHSAVVRSVSNQMEEIALQQRIISDEQREEAVEQRQVADMMRLRSEEERQKALVAQENAIASEQQAQKARQVAESERLMAEHQRIQAELSKRIADTLSYVALGRSLASLSSMQTQVGNNELAGLLAYASYQYTNRYGGDLHHPAVYQALMAASQSKLTWPRHNGAVMALALYPGNSGRMVTVSTYGEIMQHIKTGNQLQSKTLISNSSYDFRDVYIDSDSTIYAVSRSGHLAVISRGTPTVMEVKGLEYPIGITPMDANQLLIVGDHGVALYNKQRRSIVAVRELDYHLTTSTRSSNMPLLFDDRGRQHLVKSIDEFVTSNVPFSGSVTAYAESKTFKQRAYGMSDGTIYLHHDDDNKTVKLQGHLSRVSSLQFDGWRLLSSSYDGSVNLWNTNSDKIEPMTLLSAGTWIMEIKFDATKQYVWIGDQKGNVTEALLSVPMMAEIISKNLKRNFTVDEWNYYIGRKVPYEAFVPETRKEAAP